MESTFHLPIECIAILRTQSEAGLEIDLGNGIMAQLLVAKLVDE